MRIELRNMGASPVRVTGSHETWRFQDGGTFIVVRNHLNDAVPIGILVKYRRVRGRRRAAVGEEPVLPGRAGPRWLRPGAGDTKGRWAMGKGSSGGGKGGSGTKGGGSGGAKAGASSPKGGQGQGGNWPSTTGKPSGGGRGNAPPSK